MKTRVVHGFQDFLYGILIELCTNIFNNSGLLWVHWCIAYLVSLSPSLIFLINVSSIWNPFVVMFELTPLSKSTCKNWICFHAMKNLVIRSHLRLTVLEPQDFKDCYKLLKKNCNHPCQILAKGSRQAKIGGEEGSLKGERTGP